jgi:DNA-directed RNA polymerase specialized sigma24 family protein
VSGADFRQAVPAIAQKATFEARRLIGLGWFRLDEQADLEQDLLLHCWRKRKAIPTGATGSPYGAVVLRNKARDLVRHDHAPVRDRRKSDPLPEEPSDDDRGSTLPCTLMIEPRYDNPSMCVA